MTLTRLIPALLLATCSLTACYRHDVRGFDIKVPEMKTVEEFEFVKSSLLRLNQLAMPGQKAPMYDELNFDVASNTIYVRYNARLHSKKNIEHAIAKLGYTANGIPGDTNALQRTRARLKR